MGVAEWLFNECARELGFPAGKYSIDNDGDQIADIVYDGRCTEDGFKNFLKQVQSLYGDLADNQFDFDVQYHISRAEQELLAFLDGSRPYGLCPCSWGNVATIEEAQYGRYWDGHSYSYFFDPGENLPFFRVE